jgi:hypothetical protein
MLRKLLAVALLAMPTIAHADWYEASTDHFIVYSEQRPEKLKEFATQLERFDKGIRALRNMKDPQVDRANRLTVYVVDDTGDVAKLAGTRWAAGFYRPRAGGSLAIVPRASGSGYIVDLSPLAILLHEYTHHIMWTMAPGSAFPGWFIEGYAEFHATATFGKNGSITFGEPPLYRAQGLMQGNGLPVDKMLIADTLKLDDTQREALYGRGWLLTHYLTSPQVTTRKGQLAAYIDAINAGKSLSEAAAVFGDLRVLDRELERYKMGRLSTLMLTGTRLQIGEIAIRKLTPGEAATMDVRIRSKNGVNDKTAPGVYADAAKAAAPYPNDVGAQIVLAEAAYDARDYAVSEAAADRAIAADPKAVDGYVYKAKCHMALAHKAKDYSKETWGAIRKLIAAGNRIDPQDPEPLILYYRSFAEQGVPIPSLAKDGLYDAYVYAPQDSGLRMNLAAMFLKDRDTVRARELMAPLAYQPHGEGLAKFARLLLTKIDAGDTDGAIKALDGNNGDDAKDADGDGDGDGKKKS